MDNVIEIAHITKIYRMGDVEVPALQDVSLSIARGEFVGIMGPSGSGKSTFMNILGCLDQPTAGEYVLDGVSVAALDRDQRAEIRNRKIGFVFQSYNLLARTSALENVELPLLYSGRPLADHGEHARRALRAVGMEGREHHHPSQLSGGQQQRVAIARALINDPQILMADEPTGALDSHTSVEIMSIFQQLNRERGLTIVLVTHEPDIAAYAGRIIQFRDGRIISDHRTARPRSAAEEMEALRAAPQPAEVALC